MEQFSDILNFNLFLNIILAFETPQSKLNTVHIRSYVHNCVALPMRQMYCLLMYVYFRSQSDCKWDILLLMCCSEWSSFAMIQLNISRIILHLLNLPVNFMSIRSALQALTVDCLRHKYPDIALVWRISILLF